MPTSLPYNPDIPHVVADLAVLYAESGGVTTDAIRAYIAERGPSRDQIGRASSIALRHLQDIDTALPQNQER